MYREDNTYQPILSEPVMSQKRTKKQIYLEVLERQRKKTPTKVTEDDIIAYDYWCDEFLVNLKKEISENNEKIGRPNSKKKV